MRGEWIVIYGGVQRVGGRLVILYLNGGGRPKQIRGFCDRKTLQLGRKGAQM